MNYIILLLIASAALTFLIVSQDGLPWFFVGLLQGGTGLVVFALQALRIVNVPDGYTLPVVAGASVMGMLILLARRPGRLRVFFSPLTILVLVFSGLVVVGSFYSWHHQALEKTLKYIVANLVSFLVVLSLSAQHRRRLYSLLIIVSLVLALGVLVNLVQGGQGALRGRYGAFGIETIAAGRMVGVGFLIGLYGERYRRYRWFLLMFLGMGVLLAGSRGPVIALLGAVLLQPVLAGGGFSIYKLPRHTLWMGGALLIAVLALFLVVMLTRPAVLADSWGPLRLVQETTLSDRNIVSRLRFWETALQDVQMSPLVGLGTAGYGGSLPWRDADVWSYPHNIFLEIASEWGLLGLTVFGLMLYCGVRNIVHSGRLAREAGIEVGRNETQILAALFIFVLINAGLSSEIYNNRMLWLVLGISDVLRYEMAHQPLRWLRAQIRWSAVSSAS